MKNLALFLMVLFAGYAIADTYFGNYSWAIIDAILSAINFYTYLSFMKKEKSWM